MAEESPAQLAGLLTGLAPGSRVGGYQLERLIGVGGMAAVFRARDMRLDRVVALKLLTGDEVVRRRFAREARAVAAVDHPHIIPVYEAGESGAVLYIAMRYVAGDDLRVLLRRNGPLTPRRAAGFPGREIAALFGITSGRLYEHIDANILNASGERHRRLRALVGPALTPRAADRWRPVMRGFLAEIWDAAIGDTSRCEFVSAVAKAYPSRTIAAVLGAPDADAARLHYWSNMVQRQFDIQALSTQLPELEEAVAEAHDYVAKLVEARRAEPAEDLISAVVHATDDDGSALSELECVNLVLNLIAGGVDTTQGQLSHALRLFAAHPEQWERLRADPSLVPDAVQEVLRWEPVAPFTARVISADVSHRGVEFPAGTIVAVCAERANRETDGEAFDITAARDGKLYTFGVGPHFCIGMNLARAELEEALAFLAPRMPGLALDGPVRLGGVEGIYSVESLPLSWDR